ncbi:MAG: hypothetical protein EON61_18350 [Alphaproteobacteria bacterium]|nr:MAG: hypothetical protein EON61_18350 [Alphaproteobacteria bacterium]
MRMGLRAWMFILLAPLGAAACDPPPSAGPVGAAVVDLPPGREPLPEAVEATVAKLREIGVRGSYRDMAKFADATPGFRSNNGAMSHKDYWYLKMRTGDWPMAQVEKLLGYSYSAADTERGKVFIWPWVAALKPDEITPVAERDIDALLGAGQVQGLRRGRPWPGYVLGIAEDGTWLYFVSGSG